MGWTLLSLLLSCCWDKGNLRDKGLILAQSPRKTAHHGRGKTRQQKQKNLLVTLHPHSGSRGGRGSEALLESLKPALAPEWPMCSNKALPPRVSWPWTAPPTGNQVVFKHTSLCTELIFKAQRPFSLPLLQIHALCRTGRYRATGQAQRLH